MFYVYIITENNTLVKQYEDEEKIKSEMPKVISFIEQEHNEKVLHMLTSEQELDEEDIANVINQSQQPETTH